MTTLNVTTLKMIMAVVGTLVFLSLFSLTTHYQEISLSTCTSLNSGHNINTGHLNCAPTHNSLLSKNG